MEILEVAIGLFFGYLVLSLVVTAANEMSAAWFRRRAWMLRKGIAKLLDDEELAARLYDHPMIQESVLAARPAFARSRCCKRLVGRGPSYVRSRTFAIALLDVVRGPSSGTQAEGSTVSGGRSRCSREEAGTTPTSSGRMSRRGSTTRWRECRAGTSGARTALLLIWAASSRWPPTPTRW